MRMLVVKLKEYHGFAAFTFQWVITKGMENGGAPLIKAPIKMMLFAGYSMMKMFIYITISGIKATIADHFKVLFGDMLD